MKRKILLIVNLFIFILITTSITGSAKMLYVREAGSGYLSVQAAVDDASPGDIIIVSPGIYNENVDISRDNLTIKSLSKNPEDTVIHTLSSSDDVFSVNANKVTIEGFSIVCIYEMNNPLRTYAVNYSGISLINCSNCCINNNRLSNTNGICLSNTSHTSLNHNTFFNNRQCILLSFSSNNVLTSNQVSDNDFCICLFSSNNNTLINNKINSNHFDGIGLGSSKNNTITNNTISNNLQGIVLDSSS